MKARMLLLLALALPGLLGLAGCRRCGGGGSGGGGCGGGCCRGASQDTQGPGGVASRKTCPVSGEELGSKGDPVAVTVKGQTVLVCCPGCARRLARDPERYLAATSREPSQ